MKQASIQFHSRLLELLQRRKRGESLLISFRGRQTVKHLVESLGIPHTEIGRITVNGEPAETSTIVMDGDQVDVHPAPPPGMGMPTRFVLDTHLGRLASYLRILGFDTLYWPDAEDADLARISELEGRVLLTRDRGLLKRKQVSLGTLVPWSDPHEQLVQVTRRFGTRGEAGLFKRCAHCNGLLEAVEKEQIAGQLLPDTRAAYEEFQRCTGCGQVYWKGSHYQRMLRLLADLIPE